jgi:hypothetical protein
MEHSDQPPDVMSPYPNGPTFQSQSMNTTDDEESNFAPPETNTKRSALISAAIAPLQPEER